jgi:hypothetical protein
MTPARRSDYTAITQSDVFPMQFCSTRWIEDVPVAKRAVEIWENICKYVCTISAGPKAKIPKSSSWTFVAKAVNDKLTLCKLYAFIDAANHLLPFLELFQTDKPMVPFLASELYQSLTDMMEKFVLQTVMAGSDWSSISKIDLHNDNLLKHSKHVSIGFETKDALKAADASEVQIIEFKSQCKDFYRKISQKIIERSPLKYSLARNLDSLNPKTIATKGSKQHIMFEDVLSEVKDRRLIKSADCDELIKQHKSFVKFVQLEHKDEFKGYDLRNSLRLDQFLASYLDKKPHFTKLWNLIKTLLLLSHGQASIERGFSVNKDVLACNMSKKTLVAKRMVTDAVSSQLGPGNSYKVYKVNITKEMLTSCKAARMRYSLYLEDQSKIKATSETLKRKEHLLEQIESSKSKKRKLESTVKRLLLEADDLAQKAQQKSDFSMLSDSNSLRDKAKKVEKDIITECDALKVLQSKLKKNN